MHLVMFDVDGTLVRSCDFDSRCFVLAVEEILGSSIDTNWANYEHVTDAGILCQVFRSRGVTDGERRQVLTRLIKASFIEKVEHHLRSNRVEEIAGAAGFLEHLRHTPNIAIAIATGGWRETAELKLQAAGIALSDLVIGSASDHFQRTEIMKFAESQCGGHGWESKTYFGDGEWDQRACGTLGYNFVAIGGGLSSQPGFDDFSDARRIFSCLASLPVCRATNP